MKYQQLIFVLNSLEKNGWINKKTTLYKKMINGFPSLEIGTIFQRHKSNLASIIIFFKNCQRKSLV